MTEEINKKPRGRKPKAATQAPPTTPSWRDLVPEKYIDISNEWYSRNGIDPNKLTAEEKRELKETRVDESDLMILLGGFKEAAHARGLRSVEYRVYSNNPDHVEVGCTIQISSPSWDGISTFSGLACASKENTQYPFTNYLISMAENRAFIRAVRMALNINILGKEEVNEKPIQINGNALLSGDEECTTPQESLAILTEKKGKNFADLKNILSKRKAKYPDCENWHEFKDIPSDVCFTILGEMIS